MNGGLIFLIVFIVLVIGGYGGWVLWSRLSAKRLGLAPPGLNPFARGSRGGGDGYPAPAPAGIRGFVDNVMHRFKKRNNRSAAGAYEAQSGYGEQRGRGAGDRLNPDDEAWDSRVDNEAYYEEQELGLHAPQGQQHPAYGGAPSPGFAAEPERGRSRTREYEEGSLQAGNPFGDEHAAQSLRGVSPRPLDTSYGGAAGTAPRKEPDNTSERRSLFRENMD
ncbi:hypothetical protein P154DRAFT_420806 [Amniculicola lignicola CBS 123094]|uniref:Acid phosphatase-like protein n=1 Tax=Amniculicola lignicola CBS 123094 TaxID=1392246 RepID=A0A6A5X2X1_9PLEO|nr:hypothetical protein P154DRAFT_420806 [Amniculicola lignicola CBS 123094]